MRGTLPDQPKNLPKSRRGLSGSGTGTKSSEGELGRQRVPGTDDDPDCVPVIMFRAAADGAHPPAASAAAMPVPYHVHSMLWPFVASAMYS